ncbi:MAG: AmmeMemoRadiSam system protein B [Desulfurivibrionaceae bacterium]
MGQGITDIKKHTLLIFLMIGILMSFSVQVKSENSRQIRKPNRADQFNPADPDELTTTIEKLTDRVGTPDSPLPGKSELKALIMPHADYKYSGLTAAHASLVLDRDKYKKIILIGPDHNFEVVYGEVRQNRAYQTPLGDVPIHQDAYNLVSRSSLFRKARTSQDQQEHSLETVLPFLQHYLGSFQVVPIILGPGDMSQMSGVLTDFIDPETLIVVSANLSRYLNYKSAVKKDKNTIDHILGLEGDKLELGLDQACGIYPLKLLINMAHKLNWQPRLLHYSNSGDNGGDQGRAEGYAAIAFYEPGDLKKEEMHERR